MRKVLQHRLPVICAACTSTLGLALAISAATSCSFLRIVYEDAHSGSMTSISDLPSSSTSTNMMRPTSLGVLSACEQNSSGGDNDSNDEAMVRCAKWFSRVTIGLGCFSVALGWLLSSVLAPTDNWWRCLSIISAVTAVGQIPIFLVVEATPCVIDDQYCKMGSGAFLCVLGIVCQVVVTVVTQYFETPKWAIILYDPWKLPASDEDDDYFEDDPTADPTTDPLTTANTSSGWSRIFQRNNKRKNHMQRKVGMMMVDKHTYTLPDPTSLLLPEPTHYYRDDFHQQNNQQKQQQQQQQLNIHNQDDDDHCTMDASLTDFMVVGTEDSEDDEEDEEELIYEDLETDKNDLETDENDSELDKNDKPVTTSINTDHNAFLMKNDNTSNQQSLLPSPTGVDMFDIMELQPNEDDNLLAAAAAGTSQAQKSNTDTLVTKAQEETDDPSIQNYSSSSDDDSTVSVSSLEHKSSSAKRSSSSQRKRRRRRRRKKKKPSSCCSSSIGSSLLDTTIEEETDFDLEMEEAGTLQSHNVKINHPDVYIAGISLLDPHNAKLQNDENVCYPSASNEPKRNSQINHETVSRDIKLDKSIVDTNGFDDSAVIEVGKNSQLNSSIVKTYGSDGSDDSALIELTKNFQLNDPSSCGKIIKMDNSIADTYGSDEASL